MASLKFVCLLAVAGCINSILAVEELEVPDHQLVESIDRPVGRAYSVFTCNYRTQPGYTCLSCHRALHCYPGNVAILVDCYGLFRYCRDGRCSRFQGDQCPDENKLTTTLPMPATFNETLPGFPESSNGTIESDGLTVSGLNEEVGSTTKAPV